MTQPPTEPAHWWVEDIAPGRPEDGTITRVVAHLVRGDHTMCGRPAATATPRWRRAQPTHPTCFTCSEVGPGRYIHRDLTDAAAITYRQLDQWIHQGYISPDNPAASRGIPRVFSGDSLTVIRRMGALVAAGLRPAAACRVARGEPLAPGIRVVFDDTGTT